MSYTKWQKPYGQAKNILNYDVELIDNIAFKAIINALLITRYDADIFLITK